MSGGEGGTGTAGPRRARGSWPQGEREPGRPAHEVGGGRRREPLPGSGGVRPSMGSLGDSYDNAMCESSFATLEDELTKRRRRISTVAETPAAQPNRRRITGVWRGSVMTTSLPARRPAPVALLPPRGSARTLTFRCPKPDISIRVRQNFIEVAIEVIVPCVKVAGS